MPDLAKHMMNLVFVLTARLDFMIASENLKVWSEFSDTGFVVRIRRMHHHGQNFNFQYAITRKEWETADDVTRNKFFDDVVNGFAEFCRTGKSPKKGVYYENV